MLIKETDHGTTSPCAGRADAAFRLLVADGDRGWLGMMRMGATITAEAWNMGVKPNMDWNHSWGATALSAVAWGLLGVRPLAPGFLRILVAPQPGPLKRLRRRPDARRPRTRRTRRRHAPCRIALPAQASPP